MTTNLSFGASICLCSAAAQRLASSTHPITLLISPQSCELVVRNARASRGRLRESLDEIGKCDDAHTSQRFQPLQLLHRAQRTLAALLTVERQRHTRRLRARGTD